MMNRFRLFVMFVLITIIVLYITIPVYGVIRDAAGEDEVVFVLGSPLSATEGAEASEGLFHRLHQFLFPSKEVNVPIEMRIDIKGRIVYTDHTPYVNGIVELRSEPRYTRTDQQGYFMFESVEEGHHVISVLDEDGRVLVTAPIHIERTMNAGKVELVRLADHTLVFKVALDIELLELTMTLSKNADGTITLLEKIELGLVEFETTTETSVENSETTNSSDEDAELPVTQEHPDEGEPDEPAEEPDELDDKEEDPAPSEQRDDAILPPSPSPDRFGFEVIDTKDKMKYNSNSAVKVNIFGAKKRIAPGMEGSYAFTVDNRNSTVSARYQIAFDAVDTLPPDYKLPVVYRLKKDGVYVAGNSNTWLTSVDLVQDAVLDKGKTAKYTLEWYWAEGDKDTEYAQFGADPQYSYSLTITVTAHSQ